MTTPEPEPIAEPSASAASETAPPPKAAPPRTSSRTRVLIALPLVVTLLLAGLLLWTRTEPTASGGFCSRATLELTRIIHVSEGSGRVDYNRTQQAASALELGYLADVSKLRDGAPAELRQPLAEAERLLPAYRKARQQAEDVGKPAPEPPKDLAAALATFVAIYYQQCI